MITETLEQFTKRINNDMERQRKYGGTIYGAVGKALDNTQTADIAKWFAEQISESALRYYLEEQIVAAVINKIKYNS